MESPLKYVIFDRKDLLTESLSNALARYDSTMIFAFDDRMIDGSGGAHWNIASLMLICDHAGSDMDVLARRVLALRASNPDLKLAVLSDRDDVESVIRTLRLGAHGFIPTSLSLQIVVQALRLIFAGGVFVPSSSVMALQMQPKAEGKALELIAKGLLSDRELVVAKALRRGFPNRQISLQMGVCDSTVKMLVRNVMRKLQAKNRTEVAFLMHSLKDTDAPGS